MFLLKSREIVSPLIIFPIKWIISNATWYFHYVTRILKIDKITNKYYNSEIIYFNKFFKLHNGNNIFVCKTDFLLADFKKISKIPNNVILVTGNSDIPIDSSYFSKLPSNVYKWYAQNATFSNEKIIPIPLGIENFDFALRKGHGVKYRRVEEKIDLLSKESGITPTKFIYANFSISTNTSYRQTIYDFVKKIPYIDLEDPVLSVSEFYNKILDYKMILCPIGNGIDTHRLWEVLYSKRVPVIIRINECKIYDLYTKFPILILDDISDLKNAPLIEELYKLAINKYFNDDLLNYSYWEKMIKDDLPNLNCN
jgi:hypothetical protein